MMRYAIALLMVGLGLVACDMGTRQVSATDSSVTYEIDRDDPSEAEAKAADYCGRSGRSAQFNGIADYGGAQRVTFRCV